MAHRSIPRALVVSSLVAAFLVPCSVAEEDASRGRALLEEGVALRRSDPGRAGPILEEALSLLERSGDLAGQAEAHRNLGILARSSGRQEEALRRYGIALDLARRAGDDQIHGAVLNSLGILYRRRGDYARALETHAEGLELARRSGDRISQARLVGSIQRVYAESGNVASARQAARLAVALAERGAAPPDLMQVLLDSLSVTLTKEGRLWEALGVLARVEALEGIPETLLWGMLNTRSLIFRELGDLERAHQDSARAVELARQAAGRADLLGIQYNLALIMEERGETEESARLLEECLAGLEEIGDHYETLYVLNALATQALRRGDLESAAAWSGRAGDLVEGSEIEDPYVLEEVHRTRARIATARGETEAALLNAAEAIRLADLSGRTADRARAREVLAEAELARDRHEAAERLLREAVQIEFEFRARLPLDSRLTLGRLQTRPSRRLALLLLERGGEAGGEARLEEATRILDRDRARTFVEMLSNAGARWPSGDPVDSPGGKGGAQSEVLAALSRELIREEKDPARRRRLRRELGLAAETRPPAGNAANSPAVSGSPDSDMDVLLSVLREEKAVLVTFLLEPEAGWALLTTPAGLEAVRLDGQQEILELAGRIESLLGQPDGGNGPDPLPALERISALVLQPWIDRIPAGTGMLVIVPDGILERVPFEALRLAARGERSSRYLVEDFAVLHVPSGAAWLALRKRQGGSDPGTALVLADPAYEGRGPWTPLRASRREADLLASLAGQSATVLLGEEATERAWKRLEPARYQLIHLAAHGVAHPARPTRSGIVLPPGDPGEDGLLQMREILAAPMAAELVVLSSCRSAVGPVDRAEGMISLPLAFLESGARSVLATLWEVGDERSSRFIQAFYAAVARGERPVDALRSAKLKMIRSGVPPLAAAGTWAPFILIGDAEGQVELTGRPSRNLLLMMGALVPTLLLLAYLLDRLFATRRRRRG